ncbi:MAG: hypothetical protein ACYC0V_09795, partial [Armatimonadota bacterium]
MNTIDLAFITDPEKAAITSIGWDTEGTGREQVNLLRPDSAIKLVFNIEGRQVHSTELQSVCVKADARSVEYRVTLPQGGDVGWKFRLLRDGFETSVHGEGMHDCVISGIEMIFPFNPRITASTVLPSRIAKDGRFALPVIINAPDYGQLLLQSHSKRTVHSRLEGNYSLRTVDYSVELGTLYCDEPIVLKASSVHPQKPDGISNDLWKRVRRGWFGAIETLSNPLPGDIRLNEGPSLARAGLLGNEVISGIATCSSWYYADHAFWVPEVDGVSVANLLRESIDWCLKTRWVPGSGLTGYFGQPNMIDSNPSLLISAWDYVESTGDIRWLSTQITDLEKVADFLA